jgi:hypothetical protein
LFAVTEEVDRGMFCPECGAEYVPGFTRCADCGVDLVDHLPEEEPAAPSPQPRKLDVSTDLVTVLHCGDPGRLGLAKSLLHSADIPYLVHNEASWYGSGLVEIRVAQADAQDARQIVEDLERNLP